jgi:predicted HAD superfamily hydrolase
MLFSQLSNKYQLAQDCLGISEREEIGLEANIGVFLSALVAQANVAVVDSIYMGILRQGLIDIVEDAKVTGCHL